LVTKNYKIDHLPTWSPTWYIAFEVKPLYRYGHWSNLIHFTASGQNVKQFGDRIPAIFFIPHQQKLHICTGLNNNKNFCYNTKPLKLHQWAVVEILQIQHGVKYFYIIRIDGKQVLKVQNKNARYFMGVDVYRSDRFYRQAPAKIRNFVYQNLPSAFKLTRNTIIKGYRAYFTEYEISFDIKPFGKVGKWSSIIHVTEWDDISAYGNRIPAVFFHPNTNLLHICSAINGNKNYCWNAKYDLPQNKFTKIIIRQRFIGNAYYYFIFLNGHQALRIVNKKPVTLYRAKVYLSDPWYAAAKAFVKNVKVTTSSRGGFKLVKGKLIRVIPRVHKEWYLSFDIKPENAVVNRWASILHMTTGGNHGRVGQRIPGIWFHGKTRRLHVCNGINKNANHCFDTRYNLAPNRYSNIQVLQVFDRLAQKYKLKVLVNNQILAEVWNLHPTSFQNVKMYTADPWHPAARASLRNIVFRNLW